MEPKATLSTRTQLTRTGAALFGILTVWSVLAGLGILPSAAAIVAFAQALAADSGAPAWVVGALLVSVVVNLVLAVLAIQGWRYARSLELDMELIGEEFAHRKPTTPPWLPDGSGNVAATNGDLEQLYQSATAAARAAIGSDAVVGIGWVSLDQPLVTFHGWSESGQKECRIWTNPGQQPAVLGIERRSRPFHTLRRPIWRDDPSWVDLIAKSWAVESPFSGSVTLWPRADHEVKPGEGLWRLEYTPVAEGVRGRATTYTVADGELQRRSPVPSVTASKPAVSDAE